MSELGTDSSVDSNETGVDAHEATPDTVAKILIEGIEADNEGLRSKLADIDASFRDDEIAQKALSAIGVALVALGAVGAVAFPPLAVGMVAAAVAGIGVVATGEHIGKNLRLYKHDSKEHAIRKFNENEEAA
jgi:hypothetical protein